MHGAISFGKIATCIEINNITISISDEQMAGDKDFIYINNRPKLIAKLDHCLLGTFICFERPVKCFFVPKKENTNICVCKLELKEIEKKFFIDNKNDLPWLAVKIEADSNGNLGPIVG